MSLANIANVPGSPEQLAAWAFNYMAWIRDNNRIIQADVGVQLPEYALSNIPLANSGVWLYQNQDWHNRRNAVLGIKGNDLTDVDFSDPEQLATWIFLLFTEEQQAGAILGLG